MRGVKEDGASILCCPLAMEPSNIQALQVEVTAALQDDKVRYLIFQGDEPGVTFCHGMSLEFVAQSTQESQCHAGVHAFRELMITIHHSHKPTIAVVEGSAIGGGVGLVSACDFVLASENASFTLSEGLYGLLPGIIAPFLLRRITQQKLKQLLFTTEVLRGERAVSWGLVDELVSDAMAVHRALNKILRALRRTHKATFYDTKQLLRAIEGKDAVSTSELGVNLLLDRLSNPTCIEYITNYLEYGMLPGHA